MTLIISLNHQLLSLCLISPTLITSLLLNPTQSNLIILSFHPIIHQFKYFNYLFNLWNLHSVKFIVLNHCLSFHSFLREWHYSCLVILFVSSNFQSLFSINLIHHYFIQFIYLISHFRSISFHYLILIFICFIIIILYLN